jgi:hypothetical protein
MHFKVNLKRFLIKLLVQLSEDLVLYLVPSLKSVIKHPWLQNIKQKSKWIKDVPMILNTIQVVSELSCLQYLKLLNLEFSTVLLFFLYFYIDSIVEEFNDEEFKKNFLKYRGLNSGPCTC